MSRFLPDPPLLVEISRRMVRVSAPGGAPLVLSLASPPGSALNSSPAATSATTPAAALANAPAGASSDGTGFSWDAALSAVEQLVRRLRPRRARLGVVLADAWMRYFVIDWPTQKLSAAEAQAFAAQAFTQLYEQPAGDWVLTTASTGLPGKRLLCGMQRSAVAALDAVLQRCDWQLENLTGAFAAGFDLAAPALAGATGYFVYSHDGVAHCARLEAGALAMVRSQSMADASAMARANLARRCAALAPSLVPGAAPAATPFHSLLVDCDPGDFPAAAGRNLRRELLAGGKGRNGGKGLNAGKRRNRFLAQIGNQWLAA